MPRFFMKVTEPRFIGKSKFFMKLCSIASGSSGNAIYVGNDDTHILVDAGISTKKIVNGLNELWLSPYDLSGILITHEHIDHIGGLGVFLRKYDVPVYATAGTIKGTKASMRFSALKIAMKLFFTVVGSDTSKYIGITRVTFLSEHSLAHPSILPSRRSQA